MARPRLQYLLVTLVLTAAAGTVLSSSTYAQGSGVRNLGFEVPIGTEEGGWFNPTSPTYEVTLRTDGPVEGAQYAELKNITPPTGHQFGNIMQSFDATPYRGHTVRFRAYVRVKAGERTRAQLWMRVDRTNRKMGFFDNMGDRPIRSTSWAPYEIVGDIEDDAQALNIGCMLMGTGAVDIDSVSLTILNGSARLPLEKPRAISQQGLENLQAFAKLYGYMRFFYPSDAVAQANWDNIALNGVAAIEGAKTDEELAGKLQYFFASVAPMLQVYPASAQRVLPTQEGDPANAVAWYHSGVGLTKGSENVYTSIRRTATGEIVGKPIPAGIYGGVEQAMDAAALRGKNVELSVFLRGLTSERRIPSDVQLAIWSYHGGWSSTPVALDSVDPREEVKGAGWKQARVAGVVPMNADSIKVTIHTFSHARIVMDDASLTSGRSGKNMLEDPSFEASFTKWSGSPTEYYTELPSSKYVHSGKSSILVTPAGIDPNAEQPPFPGTTSQEFVLTKNLRCSFPLALIDPANPTPTHAIDSLPVGFKPNGDDRRTRLADVIITWNVMQHFYPYFDVVKVDWASALPWALRQAAVDESGEDFHMTLQRMMALLQDGHGFVSGRSSITQPAFSAVKIGGKYVISELANLYQGGLKIGDVVSEIEGKPISYWYPRIDSITPAGSKQSHEYRVLHNLFALLNKDTVQVGVIGSDGAARTVLVPTHNYSYGMVNRHPKHITELKPGIMYMDIDATTAAEFDSAMPYLKNAKAIIFDLRGYPGEAGFTTISHIIDAPVSSALWTIPQVMYPDRKNMTWDSSSWEIPPAEPRFTKNIVHLTDGQAVSAAETYMAIIERYHLGEIVGDVTAGTNGNVNPFPLPGGYRVMWTGMRVLKHDGSQHHLIGIHPTIPAQPTLEGLRAGRDEVLEKGIEVAEKMMVGK